MSRTCQVVLISFLAAAFAFAQIPTGTILGVVTDPSGGVVPNAADITITSTQTGATRSLQTGMDAALTAPVRAGRGAPIASRSLMVASKTPKSRVSPWQSPRKR